MKDHLVDYEMNERTKENLDEANEIIDELNSMYLGYIDEAKEVDLRSIDPPPGFIASNQKVQFQAATKKLMAAVQNIYTQNTLVREEIGHHLVALDNVLRAAKEVKGVYHALYDFYLHHFLPVAEEAISLCHLKDTPLPYAKKTVFSQV